MTPPPSPPPPSTTPLYTTAERVATIVAACLGWLFSAMDILLVIFLQEPIGAALGASPLEMKLAIGLGLLGSALGGMLFAQLGDRMGRARALALAIALYSISTGGMALVPNVAALMVLRFIAGIGTGGEWSLGFALVTEVWQPKRRGLVGGLVASMFNVGTLVAIALHQSGLHWRWVFGLAVLPAVVVIFIRLWVPESKVWGALQTARARGEVDPALEEKLRRPPVAQVFRGPLRQVTLRGVALFSLLNLAFYGFAPVFFNFLEWGADRGGLAMTRKEMLPFQLTMTASSFLMSLVAGALSDRLGRRRVFSVCAAVGALGFGAFVALTLGHDPAAGPPAGLLPVFMLITAGYGMNGVIGPLLAELYPTYLRATGPGMIQNLGKGIGGFAGPVLAGLLVEQLGFGLGIGSSGVLFAAVAGGIFLMPSVERREVSPLEQEEYLTNAR